MEVHVLHANYEIFHNVYLNVHHKNAPIKTKVIRGNQALYITKAYRKAGFDLTTRDSYFTTQVEFFTNPILTENTYFTNHREITRTWS